LNYKINNYEHIIDTKLKLKEISRSGELRVILLRPSNDGSREELVDPDAHILEDSLILSGSFNPLHDGHLNLAY
jgi:hypothetical protein